MIHFHFSYVQIIAATPKSTHGTHDGIDTHESLDDDLCWLHLVSFCNGSIIHLHLYIYMGLLAVSDAYRIRNAK
jgi:hypothetical protein